MASSVVRNFRCTSFANLANKSEALLTFQNSQRTSTRLTPKRFIIDIPPAKYGGRHTVTMIAGDGVGPELMSCVKQLFKTAEVPVDFEEVSVDSVHDDDTSLENAITAVRRNKIALKGNIETKHLKPGFVSHNLSLRVKLDLFANVVHCFSVPNVNTRHRDVDIIVIRENTEGEYKSLEHENVPGVVESLKIVTRERSERIARFAFNYARKHNRKKVTAVHKANIMKLGDGMFLETCREVAADYPEMTFEGMIVDNTCMQLVSRPQQFDVMLMPNLYGNIIANIGSGLVGGPGITVGKNFGMEYAVFETGTRNTGKSISGQNIANPVAMLLASVDMIKHLGLETHASIIESAIWQTVTEDKVHTPDLGGTATTSDVMETINAKVASQMA